MGYDNLKLEKGMYRQEGMNFTQVLESLDPSENYRGTALEGTDAFQRQLKRFGIRAKGAGSSPVEKFFRTMDSAVLFPEYIARTVRQGMEENDILPAITATTTVIDAMDYRSIYSIPTDADKELKDVMEGASIPETAVKTKEHLVQLSKRGRMLVASYEAIRFQKLDLFGVMLRQIGAHIQKQQLADAVNVLISGDGNENAATQYTIGTGTLTVLLPGVDADTAGSDDATNDMSLCLRFEAGNFTFLDTGDAERNEEAALAEQYPFRLRSTVFKAGHHGSSTSNTQTLLWQVQPQLVVASCGLNNDYGHPHREVIQEMQDEGIDFYRTDLYGTVTVTAQADGSFTVQTAKQPDEELAPAA